MIIKPKKRWNKKGSVVALLNIIVLLFLVVSLSLYYASKTDQSTSQLTGASVGIVSEGIEKKVIINRITFFSIALAGLYASAQVGLHFGSRQNHLRKKLTELDYCLENEEGEILKENYREVYDLYLKLSEKHKVNFYSKLAELRERIEKQLRAEKMVEELFNRNSRGSIAEQKENYLKIKEFYDQLSPKIKEKHHGHLAHLKERLERGKGF